MMKQQDHLQIFDLILTVRSPLFIGDGRMYTKAEYLYCTRNGRASLLDEQKFFTFLTDRGLIDRYIQFMLCNQSNLRDFLTEDCGVSDTDLNALTRYTIEAGDAVTNPPKNLYTFQRDAHDRAYIPGSSLKGALRTVWLLHLLLTPLPAGAVPAANGEEKTQLTAPSNSAVRSSDWTRTRHNGYSKPLV